MVEHLRQAVPRVDRTGGRGPQRPDVVTGLVQPDVANGRVYYLASGSDASDYVLEAFNTTNFTQIGSVAVSGVSGTPGSLILVPGGVAFRTSGSQIFIVNSPLVAPPAGTADLAIASFVLSYVADLENCAAELARVLRAGARIARALNRALGSVRSL